MSAAPEQLRLLGGDTFALPQVNLLPPEIAEKAVFRRVQLGLGAAVVTALGVVGLLYLSAASSATSAQGDLIPRPRPARSCRRSRRSTPR